MYILLYIYIHTYTYIYIHNIQEMHIFECATGQGLSLRADVHAQWNAQTKAWYDGKRSCKERERIDLFDCKEKSRTKKLKQMSDTIKDNYQTTTKRILLCSFFRSLGDVSSDLQVCANSEEKFIGHVRTHFVSLVWRILKVRTSQNCVDMLFMHLQHELRGRSGSQWQVWDCRGATAKQSAVLWPQHVGHGKVMEASLWGKSHWRHL